jgi:outer membrane protein assembly factor BamB
MPPQRGGGLEAHYASPMITSGNTVLVAVNQAAKNDYRVVALNGTTGDHLWSLKTDYTPYSDGWTPPFPASLTPTNQLALAGAGGTILLRDNPDALQGTVRRRVFYGEAQWRANKQTYVSTVYVNTPITSDGEGNLFFGFEVEGQNPANLAGGLARISVKGHGSWVGAAAASGDSSIAGLSMGAAPALSADGKTVYVAVSDGAAGYLMALDARTLATKAKIRLLDPSNGMEAWLNSDSSASPTVAPDGDVYFGVLEASYPSHDGRGWLLHYNSALSETKIPGSFGWDATASILPASAVPSYKGPSTYLLVVKYNNYDGTGPHGDGLNRLAVLDPASTQIDPFSGTTVLGEFETILSPRKQAGGSPDARYEWCINSIVVDPIGGAVFANNEDGRFYRWDLAQNSLSKGFHLNAPQLEAYTPTLIGPDGTVYAMNKATLYAVGN